MESNKTEYTTVSIPKNVFLRLTKLVGHFNFVSTREVVSWCIRQNEHQIKAYLREIEKLKEETGREFGHEEH